MTLRARPHARPKPDTPLKRSRVQEKATAERLHGRVTRASGATPYEKADVRVKGLYRVECKTTSTASYRVTEGTINALEDAAVGTDELPILEVELGSGRRLYVVPAWAMEDLLERARKSTLASSNRSPNE